MTGKSSESARNTTIAKCPTYFWSTSTCTSTASTQRQAKSTKEMP
jgi:hypothetical protein